MNQKVGPYMWENVLPTELTRISHSTTFSRSQELGPPGSRNFPRCFYQCMVISSPIIHEFLIKGLHSAARKWGPFKDECHVACDKPYLTSYNVMANVQGRKLCPEYFNLPGNDILVTGANWRAMCKEKVNVL